MSWEENLIENGRDGGYWEVSPRLSRDEADRSAPLPDEGVPPRTKGRPRKGRGPGTSPSDEVGGGPLA